MLLTPGFQRCRSAWKQPRTRSVWRLTHDHRDARQYYADLLDGGDGNDHLEFGDIGRGAAANDDVNRMVGGSGTDVLVGGRRPDELQGGPGSDRLSGHGSGDQIFGGGGNDLLDGGVGADYLVAEPRPAHLGTSATGARTDPASTPRSTANGFGVSLSLDPPIGRGEIGGVSA